MREFKNTPAPTGLRVPSTTPHHWCTDRRARSCPRRRGAPTSPARGALLPYRLRVDRSNIAGVQFSSLDFFQLLSNRQPLRTRTVGAFRQCVRQRHGRSLTVWPINGSKRSSGSDVTTSRSYISGVSVLRSQTVSGGSSSSRSTWVAVNC